MNNIVQALVSDSIQFGNVPPNLLLTMRQQGFSEIKLIAGSFNGTTYSLIALAKHKRMEDLKGGARLGMSGFTSAGTYDDEAAAQGARRALSARLQFDLHWQRLDAGLYQALQTGQIDAALLAQPLSLMAIEQGLEQSRRRLQS